MNKNMIILIGIILLWLLVIRPLSVKKSKADEPAEHTNRGAVQTVQNTAKQAAETAKEKQTGAVAPIKDTLQKATDVAKENQVSGIVKQSKALAKQTLDDDLKNYPIRTYTN